MTEQTLEFFVGMTCNGCKDAVTRILSKIPSIREQTIELEQKRVLVTGTMTSEEVLAKLQKWGTAANKEVRFVGAV